MPAFLRMAAKRRGYWPRQAASLLVPPSSVVTGSAKRRGYWPRQAAWLLAPPSGSATTAAALVATIWSRPAAPSNSAFFSTPPSASPALFFGFFSSSTWRLAVSVAGFTNISNAKLLRARPKSNRDSHKTRQSRRSTKFCRTRRGGPENNKIVFAHHAVASAWSLAYHQPRLAVADSARSYRFVRPCPNPGTHAAP